MISSLFELPVRAVSLALAPTRFAVRTVARLLRDDAPQAEPEAAPPTPPPAPRFERAPDADPPARAKARPKPSPKAARRAARREPTRGQAAAIRERQREEEQAAGGPGPGPSIQVEEPWPGYAGMSEDEVLERLTGANPTVRAAVRLYESMHENRRQVVLATE